MIGIFIGLIPIIVILVSSGLIVGLVIQEVVRVRRIRRLRNEIHRANETIQTVYTILGVDVGKDGKSFEKK